MLSQKGRIATMIRNVTLESNQLRLFLTITITDNYILRKWNPFVVMIVIIMYTEQNGNVLHTLRLKVHAIDATKMAFL